MYLYLFNLQELWVGRVVHNQNGHCDLCPIHWTTAYLKQRGSNPEVSEDVGMFHELRMWMSGASLTQYFAHSLS